jgi:MtrB/PioB family decaheme-associated outer membrane protein
LINFLSMPVESVIVTFKNPGAFFLAVLLFFLLPTFSWSQENSPPEKKSIPEIPVIRSLDSILLGGLEEDEDLVEEGMTGTFSLGGAGVALGNPSSMFRRYEGIGNDSGYFHGNADLSYHQGSYFANFLAEDLGLSNRSLSLDIGRYEDYKFTASYSQLPQLLSDNSKTPLNGLGGSSFSLPAGFVTGQSGANVTSTGIKDVDLKIDGRNTTAFGFSKSVEKNTFDLSYQRQTKKGSKSLGAVVGTTGGNARTIILPETIDQASNEMTASFSHVDDNSQFKMEYFLSLFENQIESLTFQGPYSGDIELLPTAVPVVNAPNAGLISRPPDNIHHRFSASGRWNYSETARVSAVMEYGLMLQDEDLFAFALGTSTSLLPRQSAQAKIHSLHFNLNSSSRPSKNLGLNARYRHYQTINDTPSTLFLAVVNDDPAGQVAENSSRALISQPYDTMEDQIKLDDLAQ